MESSFVEMLLSQKHLPSPVECVSRPNTEKIAKSICALLNAQGGWVIIGVDDKYDSIGIEDLGIEKEIQSEITNNIFPMPLVYVQRESYKNKIVILITVIKGSLPPYSYKNKYYVNRGDVVTSPSSDEISRLMRDSFSIKSGWESIANLYADKDSLNGDLMNKVYRQGISSGRLAKSDNGLYSILSELQLLDSYEVKNGTVVLFAENIRQYLPQCRVRIQLMSKGKTANQFDDSITLEGNIFTLLDETIAYFKERLPRQSFFLEGKTTRMDDYIYPLDVLDEAVSNALIHRDYSDSLDEVTIFIYTDKIEISNPGRLPEKLVKSKNEVLPHGSILRNPLMAEMFYIAGEMEKTGRGMALISTRMRELGRKLPEWTSSNNRTTLSIFSKSGKMTLNERVEHFLGSRSKGHVFSKAEYIEFFEKQPSKITAQNDIQSMLSHGICEKIGNGPSTKYRIN
ncbi:MAG: putative DNA binding domain-containing protein [Bacteroidaceae bacterium]|nr:putative DNA binding domain-containing protein [Bacteroidaceae bacterium]